MTPERKKSIINLVEFGASCPHCQEALLDLLNENKKLRSALSDIKNCRDDTEVLEAVDKAIGK